MSYAETLAILNLNHVCQPCYSFGQYSKVWKGDEVRSHLIITDVETFATKITFPNFFFLQLLSNTFGV